MSQEDINKTLILLVSILLKYLISLRLSKIEKHLTAEDFPLKRWSQ